MVRASDDNTTVQKAMLKKRKKYLLLKISPGRRLGNAHLFDVTRRTDVTSSVVVLLTPVETRIGLRRVNGVWD